MKKNIHGSEVRRRIIVCLTAVFLVASIGVSSAFAASVYFKSIVNSGNSFVVAAKSDPVDPVLSAPPSSSVPQSSAPSRAPVISEQPEEAYVISFGYQEDAAVLQKCAGGTAALTYVYGNDKSKQQQVIVVANRAVSYTLSVSTLFDLDSAKYKVVYLDEDYNKCALPKAGTVVELDAKESMTYYIDFIDPIESDNGGQVILTFNFIDQAVVE